MRGARGFDPASILGEPGDGCPSAPREPLACPSRSRGPVVLVPTLGPRAGGADAYGFPLNGASQRVPLGTAPAKPGAPCPMLGPAGLGSGGACFSKTHRDGKPASLRKQSSERPFTFIDSLVTKRISPSSSALQPLGDSIRWPAGPCCPCGAC